MNAFFLVSLRLQLEIGGGGLCPAPAEVERALAAIEPAGPREAEPAAAQRGRLARVTIEADAGGGVVVRFRDGDGALVGERGLPERLSCAERTQAAAVMIAARTGAVPGEPLTPPPAIEGETTTAKTATTAIAARLPASASAAPPAPRWRDAEIEAALLGARAGESLAIGARGGLGVPIGAHGLLRAALSYVSPERAAVSGGWASWSRTALALGGAWRSGPRSGAAGFAEAGAEIVASLLHVTGADLRGTEAHLVFHPGLALTTRTGRRFAGGSALWAGLGAAFWPRVQHLSLRDVGESTDVPRFELLAALGASWGMK